MPEIPLFWKITSGKNEYIIRISEIAGMRKSRICTDHGKQTFDDVIKIYFGDTWFEFTNNPSAQNLYEIMSASAVSYL